MIKLTPQESSQHKNVCYCFNRNCPQPENDREALICASCGLDLLLKNRYRAWQIIGQGGFGRTFKGVDVSDPHLCYCAIKQFWVEPNSRNKVKAAELFGQEVRRLKVLGEHPHIPALYDYFVEAKETVFSTRIYRWR